MSSILIISFLFPPNDGVGGRRWVKFSKGLSRKGHNIYVICADRFTKRESPWSKDIVPKVQITTLPTQYPSYLYYPPKNVIEKIKYRFHLFKHKLATKGNYYDRSINWKGQLLNASREIITRNNIKYIIVSGAPFHLLMHTIKLKKLFPDVKIIVDYRDPWTNNQNSFGYKSLSKRRLQYEVGLEKQVLKESDLILVVADQMKDYLISLNKDCKRKIYTLENGFDYDDFIRRDINKGTKANKIKFLFTGTLYQNVEYLFIPFLEALNQLKATCRDDFNLLEFNFYGDFPKEYNKVVLDYKLADIVKNRGEVNLEKVYEEIIDADVCMLFLNRELSFSLSTKFCEYLSQKKTMLVFSNGGYTADFVVENRLGYEAKPNTIFSVIKKIIFDFKQNNLISNQDFDVTPFSTIALTTKLETLIL